MTGQHQGHEPQGTISPTSDTYHPLVYSLPLNRLSHCLEWLLSLVLSGGDKTWNSSHFKLMVGFLVALTPEVCACFVGVSLCLCVFQGESQQISLDSLRGIWVQKMM